MIKLLIKFLGGFIIGAIIALLVTYAFGYVMEAMQIRLYDSEADQQRNFNIFIAFTLLTAVAVGYFATKLGKKTNQSIQPNAKASVD